MTDTFTCYSCKQTFPKVRSDEASMEIARQNFGPDITQDDCEVLCKKCFEEFKAWFEKYSDRRLTS